MRLLPSTRRTAFGVPPFVIKRIYPGQSVPDLNDRGIAGLGAIDHAHLFKGLTVRMHEHRNDEIVSYLRSGAMVHKDSHGMQETITNTHLMVMNAGSGFKHEEYVPEGEVHMLQIFVRPSSDDLEPKVAFHTFESAVSANKWRAVLGPEGTDAPLQVRQKVWMHDARLTPHSELSLGDALPWPEPDHPEGYDVQVLYIFSGTVRVGNVTLNEGDTAAWAVKEYVKLETHGSHADVVLFHIDTTAPYTRSGTLSG
jgi:redox-sensitive bicupin YhaK (pirin superfamily)